MARIRTIKPEFFRHELLQDLAAEHGAEIMLVFAGLWGHCDSEGRFEWRPRQLKLDILPFLDFSMAEILDLLETAGLVKSYEVSGKRYGVIETFREHQRLTGKEAQDGVKHPEPIKEQQDAIRETSGKHRGNIGERQESQEGKGREEEREGKRKGKGNGVDAPPTGDAAAIQAPESETELQAACRETWKAYGLAYFDRYGTDPVINAKVRSQVRQFVQRIPRAEAPEVASFYVRHVDAFYVRKGHDFGQALADAEKLRMEWATNQQITGTKARQNERSGAMWQAVAEIEAGQERASA